MGDLITVLLVSPITNALIFFNNLFGNLGVAIIALTVAIRVLLTPLTLPSLKMTKKMAELAPELKKLKKRHGEDKQALAKAQMDFYREKGVNPASGCLPQIVQIIILIALFNVFSTVLRPDGDLTSKINSLLYPPLKLSSDFVLNTRFLWIDVTTPDIIPVSGLPLGLKGVPGILLVGATLVQLLSSKLLYPTVVKSEKIAKKTPEASDDIMASTQKSMMYTFPLMTLVIGYSFPSGLVLYWLVFSVFQTVQQLVVNKPGTLKLLLKKVVNF